MRHEKLDAALEAAVKVEMMKQQIAVTLNRRANGDLSTNEAKGEVAHARDIIERWRLGDDYPFGEVEE